MEFVVVIDLHCHILPGVDDGPSSFAESLELCRAAARSGVREMIATPHQLHPRWLNDDPDGLRSLLLQLATELEGELRLHLGSEIRVASDLFDQLEAEQPRVCSLADSRYLLLELPREDVAIDPEELTRELRLSGWYPVFAHPECIPWLATDLPRLLRMVDAGALLQVTTTSLRGSFGRLPRYAARRLLDHQAVHFLASDAHDLKHRPPDLEEGRRIVARRWGQERAEELTEGNQQRVVQDLPLRQVA